MEEIKQLSSIDINHLVNEFQVLIGGKIENIYQQNKNIYFQIYKSGEKKQFLKIMLPNFIYLTEHKENTPQMPPNFCSILRKNLKGSKILEIKQIKLERIIKINFQKKDKIFVLIIELFGNGNLILCNENQKIIYPFEYQKWKDRLIKGGQQYIYPESKINLKNSTKNDINKIISQTKMNSSVTFIAKELGVGGKYAELLCEKLKIDKTSKPTVINSQDIIDELKIILNSKSELNKILDKQLTIKTIKTQKEESHKEINAKKSKLEKILEAQESTIKKQEKIIKDSNNAAEKIYENYSEIENILSEIKKAKNKYSWKEIKEKLKDHKIIKKINEKAGKIKILLE